MDNSRETDVRRAYGARRVRNEKREQKSSQTAPVTGYGRDRKRRIENYSKKNELHKKRISAALAMVAAIVVAVVLVFMTPIFDITEIRVEGNSVVDMQSIKNKVGDMIGENLFAVRKSVIEKKLLEISQINEVYVSKHIFPPSLTVTIEESIPAAYMLSGRNIIVINADLKIIDDSGLYDTDTLPSVSGISVASYKLNEQLRSDSEEKEEVLRALLSSLDKTKLLERTTYISVDDITNISFNYDNRLEVLCGSQLELDRKIRMLREALNSESISKNSIGTMDLSVPGQAVYTP